MWHFLKWRVVEQTRHNRYSIYILVLLFYSAEILSININSINYNIQLNLIFEKSNKKITNNFQYIKRYKLIIYDFIQNVMKILIN